MFVFKSFPVWVPRVSIFKSLASCIFKTTHFKYSEDRIKAPFHILSLKMFVGLVMLVLITYRFDFGNASFGYSREYYSSIKEPFTPHLRDNEVDDIKRDSIHRHIMFVMDRFTSLYIVPTAHFIWSTALSPISQMMCQCFVYLKDVMWQSMYDSAQMIYFDTLLPLCTVIWHNIRYMTQYISEPIQAIIHHCIHCFRSIYMAFVDFFYDRMCFVCTKITHSVRMIMDYAIKSLHRIHPILMGVISAFYDVTVHLAYLIGDGLLFIYRVLIQVIQPLSVAIHTLWISIYDRMCIVCAAITHNVHVMMNYLAPIINSIYDNCCITCAIVSRIIVSSLVDAIEWIVESIRHIHPILMGVVAAFYDVTIHLAYLISDGLQLIFDILYHCISQVIRPLLPIVRYVQYYWNVFDEMISDFVLDSLQVMFRVMSGMCTFIMWIFGVTHRYLLEMNVAKLSIANANNYEIGVYYARSSTMYQNILNISDKAITDDYVYLWLRNNNELQRVNAKIIVVE
eukprot:598433_1